jgi:hypothetical protein
MQPRCQHKFAVLLGAPVALSVLAQSSQLPPARELSALWAALEVDVRQAFSPQEVTFEGYDRNSVT